MKSFFTGAMSTNEEPNAVTRVGVWVTRIIYPIVMLFLLKMMHAEKVKQRQRNHLAESTYQQWLNRLVLIFMSMNLLFLFCAFMNEIPGICLYVNAKISVTLWIASHIVATFYQITRLKFCFSSQSIHSQMYGYNNWIFNVLYLIGFIFIAYGILLGFMSFTVSEQEPNLGCLVEENDDKVIASAGLSFIVSYICWDVSILLLYIYKIQQINRNKNLKKNDKIYIRIKNILNKITILTIIFELQSFVFVTSYIIGAVIFNIKTLIDAVNGPIFCILDVIVIKLMMEHNDEQYQHFLNFCKCLRRYHIEQMVMNDIIMPPQLDKRSTVDTKTVNGVKIDHDQIEQSEYTQTIE